MSDHCESYASSTEPREMPVPDHDDEMDAQDTYAPVEERMHLPESAQDEQEEEDEAEAEPPHAARDSDGSSPGGKRSATFPPDEDEVPRLDIRADAGAAAAAAEEEEEEEDATAGTHTDNTNHNDANARLLHMYAQSAANTPAYATQPATTPNAQGRALVRRSSHHITPRSTGTPRATSPSNGRPHLAPSIFSVDPSAYYENNQRLRRGSMLAAARYSVVRRGSSVARTIGSPSEARSHSAGRHRLTEGEAYAASWMADNDARRQEVYERAQQLRLSEEAFMVEAELEKERANYGHRLEMEAELQQRTSRSRQLREQRTASAAARRQAMEKKRVEALVARIAEVDAMPPDPYMNILARRRYSTPVITPRRRDSTRVEKNNDNNNYNANEPNSRIHRHNGVAAPAVENGSRRSGSRSHGLGAKAWQVPVRAPSADPVRAWR